MPRAYAGIQSAAKAAVRFTATAPREIIWGIHTTPCGPMIVGIDENNAIRYFNFTNNRPATAMLKEWQRQWPEAVFTENKTATKKIVTTVFTPAKTAQRDMKIRVAGTPFQQAVWQALVNIPYGEVVSYAEIARRIGKPKAVRAVGTACGANPVPVLIPCHRVITSSGTLGGFGGGLPLKQKMLKAEGAKLPA